VVATKKGSWYLISQKKDLLETGGMMIFLLVVFLVVFACVIIDF